MMSVYRRLAAEWPKCELVVLKPRSAGMSTSLFAGRPILRLLPTWFAQSPE
jgi:hypothetical protein